MVNNGFRLRLQTIAQVILGSILALLGMAIIAYSVFCNKELQEQLVSLMIVIGIYSATGLDVSKFKWGK